MTAVKNKFLSIALVLVTLLAGLVLFSACSGNDEKPDELKVTFMVEDSASGEWKQYTEVSVENNAVTLPTVTKQYYTFANWYENKEFTGNVFTGENVTESKTVYARFIPIEVNVHINGVALGTQNLIDVVNGSYNPGENLEFDGWYTNANYTTKWDNKAETNDLYAKSVARITFNDGYQDVYSITVNPGTVYTEPAVQEIKTAEGDTSTVEKYCIWKNYMSLRDISYVDEQGNVFDFTKAIEKNTVITVKWRSPFFTYQVNEQTGNLCLTMYGADRYDDTETTAKPNTVPVMSVLSEITFDQDGDGIAESYTVESIRLETSMLDSAELKKLLIGEGIVYIQNLNANASSLEEIVLPSTLKAMQNCFNNLNKLKGITIPDGVEVIIGCFWANTATSWNNYSVYNKGDNYGFEIAIPESVKNISMLPSNLAFSHTKENAENGDFYHDGNYIFQKDARGLILIADFTEGNSVSVPEGVNGIQVGTYYNKSFQYLTLPSTFSFVNYNEDIANYPAAAFQYSSKSFLYNAQYANDVKGNIAPTGYAIFNAMEKITLLNIKQAAYPDTMPTSAFIGDATGWASISEKYYEFCDSSSLASKVAYTGENDTPNVTINYENAVTGETFSASLQKQKGNCLTLEELLAALDSANATTLKSDYESGKLLLKAVKNFGISYDLSAKLERNVYLDLSVTYSLDGGYTAKDNGDGTATITGYDKSTALIAGDGLSIVMVPDTVTIGGKTLKVTAIAANAFADVSDLGYIVLPSTLKTIGEKAFFNCAALKVADISACKLTHIGASAFEGTSLTSVTLALSELQEVGKYAFKISTLKQFCVAEGEEQRAMVGKTDLKEGEFFFVYGQVAYSYTDFASVPVGLYRFVSKTTENDVTIYDVQFVASAGGYNANTDMYNLMGATINLGDITDTDNIIRYEVMEGAFYYLTGDSYINFYCISKIHANAFVECDADEFSNWSFTYSSTYMGSAIKGSKKLKELVNDENCADIFEENWYSGYTDDGMGSNRMQEA